jgi:flagellar hook protein FlgE
MKTLKFTILLLVSILIVNFAVAQKNSVRATRKINLSANFDARAAGLSSSSVINALNIPLVGSGANSTSVDFNDLLAIANLSTNIYVFDTLGAKHKVHILFFKVGTNVWEMRVYGESQDFGESVAGYPRQFLTPNQNKNMINIFFGINGKPVKLKRAPQVTIATPWENGSSNIQRIRINISRIRQFAIDSEIYRISQDGRIK